MTKSMSQSVVYSRTSEGSWLPKIVSIDALMSVMFMKMKMTIRQNLDVWVPRP